MYFSIRSIPILFKPHCVQWWLLILCLLCGSCAKQPKPFPVSVEQAPGAAYDSWLAFENGKLVPNLVGGLEYHDPKNSKIVSRLYLIPIVPDAWSTNETVPAWAVCPDDFRCRDPQKWAQELTELKIKPEVGHVVSSGLNREPLWAAGLKAVEEQHKIRSHPQAPIVFLTQRLSKTAQQRKATVLMYMFTLGLLVAVGLWLWARRAKERESQLG